MTRPKTNKPTVPSKKRGWGNFRKIRRSHAVIGRSLFLNPMFWNNATFRMTEEFIKSVKRFQQIPVGTEATVYKVKLGDWGLQIGFTVWYNERRCRESMMISLKQALLLREIWKKKDPFSWMTSDRQWAFLRASRKASKHGVFTFEGKEYFLPKRK